MAILIPTSFTSIILMLCLTWPVNSHAATPIPKEPGEESLVEQLYDTIIGLLIRGYSLRRNGEVDYRTARQIMGVSYDDPASGELDVAPHPLFYWYDPNQDGHWEMWVDREGQGHLADAVRYNWKQEPEVNMSPDAWR